MFTDTSQVNGWIIEQLVNEVKKWLYLQEISNLNN